MEIDNSATGDPASAAHPTETSYANLPMTHAGSQRNALSIALSRVAEVEAYRGETSPDRFSNDLIHTVVTEQ